MGIRNFLEGERLISLLCVHVGGQFLRLNKTLQILGKKCIDVDTEYCYLPTIKVISSSFLNNT